MGFSELNKYCAICKLILFKESLKANGYGGMEYSKFLSNKPKYDSRIKGDILQESNLWIQKKSYESTYICKICKVPLYKEESFMRYPTLRSSVQALRDVIRIFKNDYSVKLRFDFCNLGDRIFKQFIYPFPMC